MIYIIYIYNYSCTFINIQYITDRIHVPLGFQTLPFFRTDFLVKRGKKRISATLQQKFKISTPKDQQQPL